MIDPSVVLEALGFLVTIGVLGLAARAYNRQQKSMSSRDIWRDEAAAEKARADRLEEVRADMQAQIDKLTGEVSMLREMVTGKKEIEALSTLAAAHHQETMATLLHLPELIKEAVA